MCDNGAAQNLMVHFNRPRYVEGHAFKQTPLILARTANSVRELEVIFGLGPRVVEIILARICGWMRRQHGEHEEQGWLCLRRIRPFLTQASSHDWSTMMGATAIATKKLGVRAMRFVTRWVHCFTSDTSFIPSFCNFCERYQNQVRERTQEERTYLAHGVGHGPARSHEADLSSAIM